VEIVQKIELLEHISNEHKGILRTADAVNAGVSKIYFLKFVRDYGYEQAARGVYLSPDAWADSGYILQLKCREAVLSHETALYLLGLSEREPAQCVATVKQGYNPAKLTRRGIRVYTIKREWHDLGVTEILSPMGNPVRVYDAERTLCDIFRIRSQVDRRERMAALEKYVKSGKSDLLRLMEYARLFRLEEVLKKQLELCEK